VAIFSLAKTQLQRWIAQKFCVNLVPEKAKKDAFWVSQNDILTSH
jgi:hypothetical protein